MRPCHRSLQDLTVIKSANPGAALRMTIRASHQSKLQ
jgi:hypothetical protein